MAHHDPAYKLLFSHPQMVRDLLVGFIREDWIAQLNCDSFEKVNGSYVSDDLRNRSSDIVWRVRWGDDDWVYIYLLLEFQSKPDRFMAVRVLTYVGLLYQDLLQSKELPVDRPLPSLLPIVLYNGSDRWHAARDVASLIQAGPRALQPYLPQARYLLIDEKQHAASEATPDRNLVTALFRLENSRTSGEIRNALDSLLEWLPNREQSSLRRAFSVWLQDSIMPRVQGGPWADVTDLKEMRSMLSETIQKWKMEFREEGLREGRSEGLREGVREGEAQLLLRQLQKRFGKVAESVRPQVQQASREQLETWAERILDAPNIEALFADTGSTTL